MAEVTVPLEISDKELFDGATAAEPVQEAPAEQAQPEATGEQPRADEHGRLHGEGGRFVAKPKAEEAQAPTAEAQQQTPPEQQQATDDAQVPSWRLREIREARDAAERKASEREQELFTMRQQMQALQNQFQQTQQPKQDPINIFENPDGALDQRFAPIQQQFSTLQQNTATMFSRLQAMITHGAKEVQAMEAAIQKEMAANNPQMHLLAAQMRASNDPAEVGMQWYRNNKLMAETGGDLTAYRNKIRDELLKDPAFQAQVVEAIKGQSQPNGRPPPVQLPPSLNRIAGSGASQPEGATDAGDMSDAALFKYATAPRKRA